jgi:predicted dehydrogenase
MFNAFPDTDAVMIGTDNKDHLKLFREAVRRSYHIFMMKVISMNEDECLEMIHIGDRYSKVIMSELQLRFDSQFQYAKKLLDTSRLGKIQSIYISNISQSPICYYPNWGEPELSYGSIVPLRPGDKICRGGALTDHPHPFDLIRFLTGKEFRTVKAVSAVNQRNYLKVEDHAALCGRLSDGTAYFINPSYSHMEKNTGKREPIWPKNIECHLKITGDKGFYSADFNDRHLYVAGPGIQSPDRLFVERMLHMHPFHDSILGNFAAAVSGSIPRPATTLRESYYAVRVMNAAYESISTGKVVELEDPNK